MSCTAPLLLGSVLGVLLCFLPACSGPGTRPTNEIQVIDAIRGMGEVAEAATAPNRSDRELDRKYQELLREIRDLNEEMSAANAERQVAVVRAKARESLSKAYYAKSLVLQMSDPELEKIRMTDLDQLIEKLEVLVKMTGA